MKARALQSKADDSHEGNKDSIGQSSQAELGPTQALGSGGLYLALLSGPIGVILALLAATRLFAELPVLLLPVWSLGCPPVACPGNVRQQPGEACSICGIEGCRCTIPHCSNPQQRQQPRRLLLEERQNLLSSRQDFVT